MMYETLPTPCVAIDLGIVEKNISEMIGNAARYGISLRPHIKTHRSAYLAQLQLDMGAKGITCAKLGEAEVMRRHGITDIFIAYPIIGGDKLKRYGELAKSCVLRSVVNSIEGATALSCYGESTGQCFEVLLDLDSGVERGGLKPFKAAADFASELKPLKGIKLVGLMYYPGVIYSETTKAGIEQVALRERDDILGTAVLLREAGFEIKILSGGNTPSSKVPRCLEGITEIRAGNFIFNDCAQLYFKQVTEGQCALRVVATVVSKPTDSSAIIDAGSKSLSSDCFPSNQNRFGYIIGHPELELYKLNEEHGFLKSDSPIELAIGDKIAIIPNHACVVLNLTDTAFGMRGGAVERMINVDARGKSC